MNIEIKDFRFDGRRIEVTLNVPSSYNEVTFQGNGEYKTVTITFGFIETFGKNDWRIIDIIGNQKYTGTPYDFPYEDRPLCSSEEQVKTVFQENVEVFVNTFLTAAFEIVEFSVLRLNKDNIPKVRECYWVANEYREGWVSIGFNTNRRLTKKFLIEEEVLSNLEHNNEHLFMEPLIPKVISPISSILPKPANIYTMAELEDYCSVPVYKITNLTESKTK